MERISIFDIFKVGVGPSSSHTLGPWKAALQFIQSVEGAILDRLEVHLYGSLSKTGVGHATDLAVTLGLLGYAPETVDTEAIPNIIEEITRRKELNFGGQTARFDVKRDIFFHPFSDPSHPNTLTFKGYFENMLCEKRTYYSVGGGFIVAEGAQVSEQVSVSLPYPIDVGEELLSYTEQTGLRIAEIVAENEKRFRSEEAIRSGIEQIYTTMLDCVYRGCTTTKAELPGGLRVQRRANRLCAKLLNGQPYSNLEEWEMLIKRSPNDFVSINQWVSCFALAVNEENASLGRVVTSPTNGAAGVIPAVLLYYLFFVNPEAGYEQIRDFYFTAGEVGCLFKKGATISAAVGGCQAEIGVSSAMAAAGLVELLGGSPQHALVAAEIAMEHHLGLTCDPVAGLVQVPCIERNTMGAMKAITAAHLALNTDPKEALVKFDVIVKTMWETAQEMNSKYKETAEGGLATQIAVNVAEC